MKEIQLALRHSKHSFGLITLLCFIAIVGCTTATDPDEAKMSPKDMIAQANAIDSLFLVAFNAADADAMMKLYWNSPELHMYAPAGDMQTQGFDAVKASFQKDFAAGPGAKIEYLEANNIFFADGVVGHGIFRITFPVEGGSPMIFDGRYSEVKAIRDGKMVIILDHASVPMAPPPDAEVKTDTIGAK